MTGYREPSPTRWAPPQKGPYTELTALANAHGVPHAGAATLAIDLDGMHVEIELRIDSGNVQGASFQLTGRTWPVVTLRTETDEDRTGKSFRVSRELQTGDSAFDEKIFIDSDAPDDVLQRLLGDEGRRVAVLALVSHDEFGALYIGEKGIGVRIPSPKAFEPTWVAENILPHLRTLSEAPPLPFETRTWPHTRALEWWEWLAGSTLYVVPPAVVLLGLFSSQRVYLGVLGALAGLVLFFPAKRVLRLFFRGHSSSYDQYFVGAGYLLFVSIAWGALVPMALNATIDGEPRRTVHGVVESVGGRSEDDKTAIAHVRWTDRTEEIVPVPAQAKVGDRVRSTQRRGLFGWHWVQAGDTSLEP